ncbi:MAG: transketolase [Candidatus Babeliales bacterium]
MKRTRSKEEWAQFLSYKAYRLRLLSLLMTIKAGSGHLTSCLSAADIVATLFFYLMYHNPYRYDDPRNDRFILSKGHASALLYAVWGELGVVDEDQLMSYRTFHSPYEGHPTYRFPYAEAATGSLGMGLSIGAGMAFASRFSPHTFYTYVLLGDSEIAEGSVWEAAEIAQHYKLGNVIAFIDVNRLGQSTETLYGHHLERYEARWKAFGWHTYCVDGHDIYELMDVCDKVRDHAMPVVVIAHTYKGHGIPSIENKEGYHGKMFSVDLEQQFINELQATYPAYGEYDDTVFNWEPKYVDMLTITQPVLEVPIQLPKYNKSEQCSTRKAYGEALSVIGQDERVIVLDAEVKNSTYAELFEHVYPGRFIQCFVAEQNMVSMGVGMARRGLIPFISTFSAFFSRAFDQVRMAAIGGALLKLVGSHAGISIGQDGPSQMGLEDIAVMRTVPHSLIFYPADAVATVKLLVLMKQYEEGIAYLRTTRMDTPVVYDNDEHFVVGGCKVIRQSEQDSCLVIAAGITLIQALDAYELLFEQGIAIAVIDLYSVKPFDKEMISFHASRVKHVVIVEDHYEAGGIGEAIIPTLLSLQTSVCVRHCAVKNLPRSGLPQELLAWAGIDAQGIVKAVNELLALQKV